MTFLLSNQEGCFFFQKDIKKEKKGQKQNLKFKTKLKLNVFFDFSCFVS